MTIKNGAVRDSPSRHSHVFIDVYLSVSFCLSYSWLGLCTVNLAAQIESSQIKRSTLFSDGKVYSLGEKEFWVFKGTRVKDSRHRDRTTQK